MKKIVFMLALCCMGFAHAQHEVWIHGGGGAELEGGYSWHSGLGYRYFFMPELGLGLGAEFAYVKQSFSSKSTETDIDGDAFELRKKTKGHVYMIQAPLMLQYNINGFYIGAGGKAGFPLGGEETTEKLGYFDYEDYEYIEQEFLGVGVSKEKPKTAFFLSLEAGYKWKFAEDFSLYAGAYFDYGKYAIIGGKLALAFGFDGKAKKRAKEEALLEKELGELNDMYIEAMREHHAAAGFELAQTKLSDVQRENLDKKIELLKNYPDFRFYIYGHTCDLGGPEANEKLGMERAENAKEYMVSKGIAESRIIGIGSKLDTEPLVPNTSEENRALNRRVEIVLEKGGK
jgi:outer membrane protein OmpA-like peptidoglycan-associated protein/opacity protein-like surface antigen